MSDYLAVYDSFLELNKTGMLVLAGWSMFWLLISGLAYFSKTNNVQHHFWLMNFFWSIVNLIIAAFGYYSLVDVTYENLLDFTMHYQRLLALYALNAGLDVAYMLAAFLLTERSRNVDIKKALMYRGFSAAILLQALFLFLFDGVMVLLNYDWFKDMLSEITL
ncbi:MAG: DUF6992 family protein [Luteibaculaceae bacterium]